MNVPSFPLVIEVNQTRAANVNRMRYFERFTESLHAMIRTLIGLLMQRYLQLQFALLQGGYNKKNQR